MKLTEDKKIKCDSSDEFYLLVKAFSITYHQKDIPIFGEYKKSLNYKFFNTITGYEFYFIDEKK